jgi:hypothetical protein
MREALFPSRPPYEPNREQRSGKTLSDCAPSASGQSTSSLKKWISIEAHFGDIQAERRFATDGDVAALVDTIVELVDERAKARSRPAGTTICRQARAQLSSRWIEYSTMPSFAS